MLHDDIFGDMGLGFDDAAQRLRTHGSFFNF
jgi:hypothetical protein